MIGKECSNHWRALPVDFDIASVLPWRAAPMLRDAVTILVSPSGKSIEAFTALHYAKRPRNNILLLLSVPRVPSLGNPTFCCRAWPNWR